MAVSIEQVRTISLLAHLVPDDLELLANLMVIRNYLPGELIFLEGENSSGVWFILQGQVRILKISTTGRVQALCVASAGKCFGTCPLFNEGSNPANAQALTEVTLLMLPQGEMDRLLKENTQLAWTLLKIYSQYIGQLARISESLGSFSVGSRINDCLLDHAEQTESTFIVTLTHEKLAELAGTVREVVSRHLENLAEQEIVRLEFGRIILLNPNALQLPCLSSKR